MLVTTGDPGSARQATRTKGAEGGEAADGLGVRKKSVDAESLAREEDGAPGLGSESLAIRT